MIKDSRAVKYAEWCIQEGNRKVPRYVKMQCEQWLKIIAGEDAEAYADEKAYKKLNRLLQVIIHPDLNKNMRDAMEDYAHLLTTAVFCTKTRADDSRYYETILLKIARKNFKTFNSAVIFILLMLLEPRFSRFFSVAPDLKLSSELKMALRKIIKSSPVLAEDSVFKVLRSEIRCTLTESEYTPLAYSNDKMDGKLANAFLADEAGAMDNYPIEAMRSSQITLPSKLGIIISTEYPNDNNAMIDETDKSMKILDGLIKNKRRFSLIYEPDDDLRVKDQWKTNDLVLLQANPAAVTNEKIFENLKEMRMDAVLYENKRENFLCKHCNIKFKGLGVEGYVEITKVRECKRDNNPNRWRGKSVFLGLDLSQTNDNTAVAMVYIEDDILYAKVWGFIPAFSKKEKSIRENVDYDLLIEKGVCFACGNEVIDYSAVERFILGLEEQYGVQIIQIGYDRYNAISTVQKLEERMYECVEIKQHSSVLHSPTKLVKEKILSRQFVYDENLMLEINFQNARCTEDTNLNKYVNKKKSAGKVDMVVALINATYLAEQDALYGGCAFVAQT